MSSYAPHLPAARPPAQDRTPVAVCLARCQCRSWQCLALLPFFFLLLCLCLGGCSSSGTTPPAQPLAYDMPVDPPPGSTMLDANTYAGDALSSQLLLRIGAGSPVLVATFVNLDTFSETSTFGRTTSQQVSSRVAQHGFRVTDVRLTCEMIVNRKGEFMLSRDTARILSLDYNAHAVIVGTYTLSGGRVFVSARAIRLSDAAVIGAYEYYLPYNSDVATLVGGGGRTSGEGDWNRYNQRGRFFTDAPHEVPRSAGTSVRRTSAPAQPSRPADCDPAGTATPLGRMHVPQTGDSGLPDRPNILPGGEIVDK